MTKEKIAYMKQYREKHREEIKLYEKNANLKQYGLTLQLKNEMISNQDNRCLSCGGKFKGSKNIHVDHDHKSHVVRGILCAKCNGALGMLNEDLEKIYKMAEYIKKYCNK